MKIIDNTLNDSLLIAMQERVGGEAVPQPIEVARKRGQRHLDALLAVINFIHTAPLVDVGEPLRDDSMRLL